MRRTTWSALPLLLLPAAAPAQETVVLPDLVVTAPTRTPLEAARTGASVSVIEREDLETEPAPTLAEALERAPGVAIASRGGPGASADVSIRGFGAEDVLLRIDGIELADPGELRVQPDFAQILTGDVGRIEVLKGAQSALYGGEAVGGVIDVTTARARGSGVETRAFAEAGSFATVRGGVSVGAGFEDWDAAATIQGIRSDGFSAAAGGEEDDGYRNVTASAAGSADLTGALTIGGAARVIDRETEIDGATSAGTVDIRGDAALSEVLAGRVFLRHEALDGRLVNELSLQGLTSERRFEQATPSRFDGDRVKAEWLGTLAALGPVDLLGGADWTREGVETSEGVDVSTEIAGLFGQAVLEPVERLTLVGALRRDEHSEFGGYTTWRATAALEPLDGTVLRGALGTGFRAPSNRELFSPALSIDFGGGFIFNTPVGNPDLEPEETTSWEIGVEQALFGGRARASAVYFDARTDGLIEFETGTGYTQIEGESRRRGVELALDARVSEMLDVAASYTFLDANDPDGRRLDFAPRHDARVAGALRPIDRVTLAASANYLSTVRDDGEALDPFLLVNASAAYAATETVEAYLRVENLLDQDYERQSGFATAGIAAYAGLRARF